MIILLVVPDDVIKHAIPLEERANVIKIESRHLYRTVTVSKAIKYQKEMRLILELTVGIFYISLYVYDYAA